MLFGHCIKHNLTRTATFAKFSLKHTIVTANYAQTRYQHSLLQPLISKLSSLSPAMPSLPKDPIVWIDCEMTGLDVLNDTIIEIACFITDGNLNLVDINGFESVVYKPQYVLDGMNEWCINHHGKSGLTKKIQLASPESKDLEKVEQALLEYIQKYIPDKRVGVMAGNTIHMDKFFMVREFPKVIDHLHYRLIDVSTVSETCKRFNPKLADYQPRKKNRHTAKSDILESIGQLRWFRENYLKDEKEVDFDRITGSNDLARLALK